MQTTQAYSSVKFDTWLNYSGPVALICILDEKPNLLSWVKRPVFPDPVILSVCITVLSILVNML